MIFEVVGSFDIGSNVSVQSAGMTGNGNISTRWGSGGNNTLRFVGSGDYIFTGSVGRTPYVGGMALVHNGSGTQTLAGNVYANNITIAADATLRFGDNTSATFQMDAGRTITNEGALIFDWASDNTVAGSVSGAGMLVKDGDGAVALTNPDNPYTGTTTVLDGTLLVNGGLTGGNTVTVGPDGTLGGGGSITGAVNADGTIAPGASVGAIGALAVGPATLGATGVLAADIDSSVLAADTLAVTGDLAIAAGATLKITEQAPAPTAKLTLVTYTGAWNGGIFTGFPDDTPVSVGAYTTYTVNYNDNADGLNAVTLTVVSTDPYVAWAAGFGLTGAASAKDADPDHDGSQNLLEFATAGQPANGGAGPRAYPLMHLIGGETVLTYTVAVRDGAVFAADGNRQTAVRDGVKYTVEASNSLAEWTTEVTVTELTGTPAAAVQAALGTRLTEPPLGTGWQWHTFRTDGGTPADPADFIRLQVESAQ
jgi:autotransporter-associated beta strand protein